MKDRKGKGKGIVGREGREAGGERGERDRREEQEWRFLFGAPQAKG